MNLRFQRARHSAGVMRVVLISSLFPVGHVFATDNCCEFNPPDGCASGPAVTAAACTAGGAAAFMAGHICDFTTKNCEVKAADPEPRCADLPGPTCLLVVAGDLQVSNCGAAPSGENTDVRFRVDILPDTIVGDFGDILVDLAVNGVADATHQGAIAHVPEEDCPPPAADGTCPQPTTGTRRCGITRWTFKNLPGGDIPARCVKKGDKCVCRYRDPELSNPKATKCSNVQSVVVTVDPADTYTEVDESNNVCMLNMCIPTVSQWGAIAAGVFLLAAGVVVLRKRRAGEFDASV